MGSHRFTVIGGEIAIVRFGPHDPVPDWAFGPGSLVSITRTDDELSIVCAASRVPSGLRTEGGWTALKLSGPFAFDQVGVLASIVAPLADAGVSVFALSTFDTDFVLVKTRQLREAVAALQRGGHAQET